MRALLITAILFTTFLAGCVVEDDTLVLAFVQPDDAVAASDDPETMATALADASGRPVEVYYVESTEIALQSVASGQADAAFVDGTAGFFGWKRLGLDAVAAAAGTNGATYYEAVAWVRADSPFRSMADLEGQDSCHTGLLKSAGTFMPLGWLIRNGHVDVTGPDELSSIEPTLDAYFGHVNMPASDADIYGSYPGALRCISDGTGDVAFGKDTTPDTYCGDDAQDWCLALEEYRIVQSFGRVPSHPVMVNPGLGAAKRAALVDGLVLLGSTGSGQDTLEGVLGSRSFVPVDGSEAHLGEYAANLERVPGMTQYLEDKVA